VLPLEIDVDDVTQGHLEEPGTQLAECVHVARAQEAVVTLLFLGVGEVAAPDRMLDAAAMAWPEVTSRTLRPSVRWSMGATSG